MKRFATILSFLLILTLNVSSPGDVPPEPVDIKQEVNNQEEILTVDLTNEEQAWLADHPKIVVGGEMDWAPFDFVDDNGKYAGIANDYLTIISEKLGIEMEIVSGYTWDELLSKFKDREIDVLPAIYYSEERETYANFTTSYIEVTDFVFSREDDNSISSFDDLRDKTIVVVKGYTVEGLLEANYPEFDLLAASDIRDALAKVITGKADAFIGDIISTSYNITKYSLVGIKPIIPVPFLESHVFMAIRKDWPILKRVIDKVFSTITDNEHKNIRNQWVSFAEEKINSQTGSRKAMIPVKMIIVIGLIFIAVIVLIYFLLRFLSKFSSRSDEIVMQQKNSVIIIAIGIFLTVTLLLTLVGLNQVKKQTLSQSQESLRTTLNSTSEILKLWIDHKIEEMEEVASDEILVEYVEALLQDPTDKESLSNNKTLDTLRERIKTAREIHDDTGFFIINPDYISIGSMCNTNLGTTNLIYKQRPELLKEVFEGKSNFIPPIYTDLSVSKNKSTMFYAVPIKDNTAKVIAVLTLRDSPTEVMTRLCHLGVVGSSEETYTIDEKGALISNSRFDEQLRELDLLEEDEVSILNLHARNPGGDMVKGYRPTMSREEQPLTLMAQNVVNKMDSDDIKSYPDYRGVKVLGLWRWVEDLNFGIAVEIDYDDALSSYYLTRMIILIILVIVVVLAIGATIFSILIGDKTAKALRRHSQELEEYKDKLEEEVEKRTAELSEQKEMMTMTINSLSHPFYVLDVKDYSVVLANSFAKKLAGGKTITTCHALSHYSDIPCASENDPCPLKEIQKTGKPAVLEHIHFDENGEPYYVEVHGYPIFDDKGELVQMIEYSLNIDERKRAEAEILDSKNKTDAILKASTNGIISINSAGIIETFNPAAEEIFGYSLEEIIGQNVKILVPDELAVNHDSFLENYSKTGVKNVIGKRLEVNAKRKSGELFPIEIGISDVDLKDSKLFTAIVSDITARKQAEKDIQAREEQFRTLVDNIPGVTYRCLMDENWTMLFISSEIEALTGYPTSDFLGEKSIRTFASIMHPDDLEPIAKNSQKAVDEHQSFINEYRIIDNKGETHWVYAKGQALYDDNGKPAYLDGTIFDMTDKHFAEDELRKLSLAVEQSPITVVVTDRDGSIEYVNSNFTEVTGYSSEEAIGANPRVLKSGYHDQAFYKNLWDTIINGDTWNGEFRTRKKNGDLIWESASISPVKNADGEITHFVAMKQDITEFKETQEDLELLNQLVYGSLESADVGAWWIDFSEEDTFHALDTTAKLIGLPLCQSEEKAYIISEWVEILIKTREISYVHAKAIDDTLEQFSGTIEGKYEFYRATYPVLHKDGSVIWLVARADVPKRDKNGKALVMTGTLIDITEQKKAEQALEESQERFELTVSGSGDGLWDFDIIGKSFWYSNRFRELLGYTDEHDYPSRLESWSDGLHPDDKEATLEAFKSHLENGTPYDVEYRLLTKQQEWRWFNARGKSLRDASEKSYRAAGSITDIHSRKQMENELEASRAQLQQILDTSPVGVAFSTKEIIHFANPKFIQMFDAKAGEPSPQLYANPEDRDKIINKLQAEESVVNYELKMRSKDGNLIDTLVTYLQINYHGEDGILGWLLDITDRKKAEDKLTQKLDELERFNRLVIGREVRMIDLKKEVNELLSKLSQSGKYKIVALDDADDPKFESKSED
ncbi:MAG: PAS domain S-box protein [Candidatus Electryonea clarkiae]|nr:PAS domain S-box protein [Candidatus Electryonea clarkiae]MDP8287916.1 PAS domain S-box protein [Candidatus Electryonea clarkiae]